ncbi:MAG: HAMP domain-containing sensor histidine kinase [Myxococcota bacterium]
MTTRARILLWVLGSIGATVVITWLLVELVAVRPARRELEGARVDTVLRAARALGEGHDVESVERELGVDLRVDGGTEAGPPKPPGEPGLPGDGGWRPVPHPTQRVFRRPGRENELAAWTGSGWVVLHEHTPPVAPLLLGLALLGAVPVGLLAVRVSGDALGPVLAAERSLERISAGELDHRLDVSAGPVELRRMAVAVNRMTGEIERLVQGERQRMAGLSHELRTPLTRARLELALARRGGVEEARLDRIDREITQLELLVGELLELSRLEIGGERELRREPVDLRGLVELLVDDEGHEGVEISGDGEACVDARLVRRAVSNLLRNSGQHAPDARRWVHVETDRITVGDDGPGLAEPERSRVFDVFWRAADRPQSGHGLGLAIVRQVAALHGGCAELLPGDGFVVVLTFPPTP